MLPRLAQLCLARLAAEHRTGSRGSGPFEHGLSEGGVEGSDAEVAADDTVACRFLLEGGPDAESRLGPALEVTVSSIGLELADVIGHEQVGGLDERP